MSVAESRQVESLLCTAARRGSEPPPELRIAEKPLDGLGKRLRICGWNQKSGLSVDDELRDAADVGRNDRQAGGHCLENRDRQPFRPARQHEEISRSEELADVAASADELLTSRHEAAS